MKIKKGDNVIILAGKDKGKTGTVVTTLATTSKVVVEGLNTRIHHVKSKKEGEKGQKVVKSAPIHVSNVALTDSKGKATRVGYTKDNGKKVRIAKTDGKAI